MTELIYRLGADDKEKSISRKGREINDENR